MVSIQKAQTLLQVVVWLEEELGSGPPALATMSTRPIHVLNAKHHADTGIDLSVLAVTQGLTLARQRHY